MQRENHHLDTVPLETWAAAIQQLSSEAEKCLLERVVHYKALSSKEHEFLVVYASQPTSPESKLVLGVDRNAPDLVTAASKRTSDSASHDKPSTVAPSLARYLNTLVWAQSLSPFSSLSKEEESSRLADDRVQVSHDGTPAPILAQHGRLCVPLHTITFSSTSTSSSNSDARCPPSLLHLSVLLLTIRTRFPTYDLLQYQCYFFARATCLALTDLFGGVETELEEGKRTATWHGVHINQYLAGHTALQNMVLLSAGLLTLQDMLQLSVRLQKMPLLPLVKFPAIIVPAGLITVYSAVKLYGGNVVASEVDRRRISDEKIRQHAIPNLYRAAWRSFVL